MTTTAADAVHTTHPESTTVPSPTTGLRSIRVTEAARWMIAGFLLLVTIGTQLVVGLSNRSVDGSQVGNYWLQIILVVSGLVLLVGGIVKSRRR